MLIEKQVWVICFQEVGRHMQPYGQEEIHALVHKVLSDHYVVRHDGAYMIAVSRKVFHAWRAGLVCI